MNARLDIEYIELRNFLSYGDYVTKLNVHNLGPVLILGSIDGDHGSNGAGKSSLLSAFIWCLFGRTITNQNPGNKVINWFVKKNCYVKIKTIDGWEIIRTRNFDGHNELMLRKDGDDETQSTNTNAQIKINQIFGLNYEIFTSSVFCGQFGKSFLEMSPIKRKEAIERLLGLDRLNSYADIAKDQFKQLESRQELIRAKLNLLISDIKRQEEQLKETKIKSSKYENERLDKLNIVKEKLDNIKDDLKEIKLPDIQKLKSEWNLVNSICNKIKQYENEHRDNKIKLESIRKNIVRIDQTIDSISSEYPYSIPNISDLQMEHDKFNQAKAKISKINNMILTVSGKLHNANQDIKRLEQQISNWSNKRNTNCKSCGQEIGDEYVEKHIHLSQKSLQDFKSIRDKHQNVISQLENGREDLKAIKPPQMSLEEANRLQNLNKSLKERIDKLKNERELLKIQQLKILDDNDKLSNIIEKTSDKLEKIKPKISLQDISQMESTYKLLTQRERDLSEEYSKINLEENPYHDIADGIVKIINSLKTEIESQENEASQANVLFSHYKYIYRSYSDRRKIKSWLLSELIPFLNDRIRYYLDLLDVNMRIKFGSSLNTETDKWGYEFCSGGERKRIDLSIMFGLYDLYMSIYGRQCNIMVLDEVDSRLDKEGVEAFSEIINDICTNNDDRPSPSTIFVISHKQELQSMFPSQIIIKKEDNFSKISQ